MDCPSKGILCHLHVVYLDYLEHVTNPLVHTRHNTTPHIYRMLKGWHSALDVIKQSAQYLLSGKAETFDVDQIKEGQDQLIRKTILEIVNTER